MRRRSHLNFHIEKCDASDNGAELRETDLNPNCSAASGPSGLNTNDRRHMTIQGRSLSSESVPDIAGPRRIAFCITDLDAGGAEKALLQLVTRLDRKHWEPTVFCLGPEAALAPRLREQGVCVFCYGARSWRNLGVLLWLTRHLHRLRPELLQCFLFHANLVGRMAGRWTGVPVILAGHRVAERGKRWHLWLDRWTRGWVDHHVCVSQGVARHIEQHLGVSPRQITVIPNGVEIPSAPGSQLNLRKDLGFPDDALIVLGVGRLHPQKGFDDLLTIFQQVHAKVPESRLVIVGEGAQRSLLQAQIESLGLQEAARLAGYRTDVPEIMKQSQLLAMTSKWEGMSNSVLEAMIVGLPVIAMEVEGVTELLGEGRGIVVSSGDTGGFADQMELILRNPELRSKLGDMLQDHVYKYFTWIQCARDYEKLFSRLLGESFTYDQSG